MNTKKRLGGIKTPLLFVIPVSVAIGLGVGIKIKLDHEASLKQAKPTETVRVLSPKGMISPEFQRRFENERGIRVEITEASDPEDALSRLMGSTGSQPSNSTEPDFDVVGFFSYQFANAQASLKVFQLIDPKRLRNFANASPDFRDVPAVERGLYPSIPLLWGLDGLVYNNDSQNVIQPPTWASVLRDTKLKGRIAIPGSTVEINRLLSWTNESKDLKKSLNSLRDSMNIAKNFLSPIELFASTPAPLVALISHGETAFQPFSDNIWKLTFPSDKAMPLWVFSLAIARQARNEKNAYAFLDFCLSEESAVELTRATHQASANRSIEKSTLDQKLKPSYLRTISLEKIELSRDNTRAREIRQALTDGR